MAPDPKAPSPDEQRAKMKRVLIPAVAIAGIVVLVAILVAMTGERKMSDGSNGTADDPDLKDLAPGVRYRDLKQGEGEPCMPGAQVKIKYSGWLTDGTEFDSSKGKPVDFALSGLIKGWQIGIPGMKPGGIRKLVIAPNMGYGSKTEGKVPANSTLIFEVELVSAAPPPFVSGAGKPMSDGSNGGTEDPGLTEIVGGLKFRDLKEGTGEPVAPGATVTVHYTGWTVDGNVFDSSRKDGAPVEFPLGRVVPGWQKGIPGMKPGGIRKLVIPAAFGYGAEGRGSNIPPNATLIFEVELVK